MRSSQSQFKEVKPHVLLRMIYVVCSGRKFGVFHAPPKIKHFVWRLAHNSLALKMNIKRRNIKLDTICPVCKRFDEDGAHCSLKCKLARHCWFDAQLEGVRSMLLDTNSAEEFIRRILALDSDQCLRSMVLLWKIWDTRNKINAGENRPTCTEVVCAVNSVLRDCIGDGLQQARIGVQNHAWKPPDLNYLKINIDGAFRKETKEAACGFMIRNHLGEPVLAGATNISPALDALSAETAACLFALESAERHGISRVELETDSSQLRDAIMSDSRDLALGGVLFCSIRDLLHDHFFCNKTINFPRMCNLSAHEIAKLALSLDPGQSFVWSDPLPEFVFVMVARDLAELSFINTRP